MTFGQPICGRDQIARNVTLAIQVAEEPLPTALVFLRNLRLMLRLYGFVRENGFWFSFPGE